MVSSLMHNSVRNGMNHLSPHSNSSNSKRVDVLFNTDASPALYINSYIMSKALDWTSSNFITPLEGSLHSVLSSHSKNSDTLLSIILWQLYVLPSTTIRISEKFSETDISLMKMLKKNNDSILLVY